MNPNNTALTRTTSTDSPTLASGIVLAPQGLIAPANGITDDDRRHASAWIRNVHDAGIQYASDMFRDTADNAPEMAEEVAGILGLDSAKARKALAMASVPLALRREAISPAHQFVIGRANLSEEEQDRWMELAIENNLTPGELARSLREGAIIKDAPKLRLGIKSPSSIRADFEGWSRAIAEKGGVSELKDEAVAVIYRELRPIAIFVAEMLLIHMRQERLPLEHCERRTVEIDSRLLELFAELHEEFKKAA